MRVNETRTIRSTRWSIEAQLLLLVLLVCAALLTGAHAASGAYEPVTPQRGYHPSGSYSLGDIETVNTTNGNLLFNIPLAMLPAGRSGSSSAGISLIYNSKIWDVAPAAVFDNTANNTVYVGNSLRISREGGWRYAFQYELQLLNMKDEYEYTYYYKGPTCPDRSGAELWKVRMRFPDGGVRELIPQGYEHRTSGGSGYFSVRPDGYHAGCSCVTPNGGTSTCDVPITQLTTAKMVYYSTDGTYLKLEVEHDTDGNPNNNPWTLYQPDGGRVTGTGLTSPGSGMYPSAVNASGNIRIYDRNNNYIDIQGTTYNNASATRIVDQFGRSIIIEYGSTASGSRQDYIHAWGVNNEEITWTVKWKTIKVTKSYDIATSSGFRYYLDHTLTVVDQIIAPSQVGGLTYTFGYNADTTSLAKGWGEVSSITLPSGAQASYSYVCDGQDAISWRRVIENSPKLKELNYQLEHDGTTAPAKERWRYEINTYGSRVFLPNGGIVTESYRSTQEWSSRTPLVFRSVGPDGSVVERIWRENVPYMAPGVLYTSSSSINPYVKTEFVSVADAQGRLTKTAIKDYSYDKNGNVTRVDEYDWVAYTDVVRSTDDRPTGVPQTATLKRVTINTYHRPTPDASDSTTNDPDSYHKATSPRLKGAVASVESQSGTGQPFARTEMTYDNPTTTGNLTERRSWDSQKGAYTNPLTASNSVSVTNYYDPQILGKLTQTVDARGFKTEYIYGAINGEADLYPTETRVAVGTAMQRTSLLEYDFHTGLVTLATDADNGVQTRTIYDALGRPRLVKAAEGTPEETHSVTEYDDVNRRVVSRADLNTQGDGRLVVVRHYDQLGRERLNRTLENATIQSVTDETTGIKVQTRYSNSEILCTEGTVGSYQLVSNPYRAARSNEAGAEITMGWTMSKFDKADRVYEAQTVSGAVLPSVCGVNANSTGKATTAYDAESKTITDEAGRQRRMMSDGLGNLVRVDEPNGDGALGTPTAPNQPTHYEYDVLGNLRKVTQGVQTRVFVYDSLSRLILARMPEQDATLSAAGVGGLWSAKYAYDANGNLEQATDARGVVTGYTYDALNRIKTRSYSDGTPAVTYLYDGAGMSVTPTSYFAGRLTSVKSSVSEMHYSQFDALGRVKQSSQVTDGRVYGMSYEYNLAGGMRSQTYPSGRVVYTSYDPAGRISEVYRGQGAETRFYASSFAYTAHGAVSDMRLGGASVDRPDTGQFCVTGPCKGLWEHTDFNSRLQTTRIGVGAAQDRNDASKLRINYAYGEMVNGVLDATKNNGNIESQTISVPALNGVAGLNVKQSYQYDELNRLKSAREVAGGTEQWKQTYQYDRFGNRRLDGGQTTYPDATTISANPPFYNPAISDLTNRLEGYGYDFAGSVTKDALGWKYGYDAEHRQVSFDKDPNTIEKDATYSYDGDGRRVKKVASGVTTTFVYDAGGRLVAEYTNSPQTQPGGTRFVIADVLGSTRLVADELGDVKERHDYLPFGAELFIGRTQQGYGVMDVRQKFAGYERDGESGLDFAQARYYSPVYGRFTSVDSSAKSIQLMNPQSLNRYPYCQSNPFAYVDKNGKWPTRTHKAIIERALPGLSRREISIIQRGSLLTDYGTLFEKNAPQHAMTPAYKVAEFISEGMSYQAAYMKAREWAVNEANKYIAEKWGEAIKFRDLANSSTSKSNQDYFRERSLEAFGQAMHPIMDNYSPTHSFFQVYSNTLIGNGPLFTASATRPGFYEPSPTLKAFMEDMDEHKNGEAMEPTKEQYEAMGREIRDAYNRLYGEGVQPQ